MFRTSIVAGLFVLSSFCAVVAIGRQISLQPDFFVKHNLDISDAKQDSWDRPRAPTSGDLNQDGHLDLLFSITGNLGRSYFMLADGAGGFGRPQVLINLPATSLHIVDLDDDGNLEIVRASGPTGKGYRVISYQTDPESSEIMVGQWSYLFPELGNQSATGHLQLLDLDGDGSLDAFYNFNDHLYVTYNSGGIEFSIGHQLAASGYDDDAVQIFSGFGDVDGDGDKDLVDASGGVVLWESYQSPPVPQNRYFKRSEGLTTLTPNTGPVKVFDMDGDGDMDVAIAARNSLILLKNLQGIGFDMANASAYQTAIATESANPNTIFAADVDGDGDNDLIIVDLHAESIWWIENSGSGEFQSVHLAASGLGLATGGVNVSDMNNDGLPDLVIADEISGELFWLENTRGIQTRSEPGQKQSFAEVKVYPNPTSGDVTINVTSEGTESGTIVLYNALGQILTKKPLFLGVRVNSLSINLGDRAPGIYYLSVKWGGTVEVVSLVKF